jgi:DNA invertase Pin-like site-specific DNA recombinase
MNEPTHFDLVTIGGGFAGPCTAVLEAGTDASYLMLTVPGGLREFERDLIRARTSEGCERAKARGVKLGRKPKLSRTPEARGDPAARLSTAGRCQTSPAATTCCTARFSD